MFPKHQAAVGVRYFTDNGSQYFRDYHYKVPDFIPLPDLKLGGHVVVYSGSSKKPEVCAITSIMPQGSPRATKEIIGIAHLPGNRREELLKLLATRERELMSDPMLRYARLAQADAEAALLYQQLASLGACP